MGQNTRRNFLKTAGLGILTVPLVSSLTGFTVNNGDAANAQEPPLTIPEIPVKVKLNVRDFGATGDGTARDTAAIQQAIDRCWVLGGGEVIVPAGNYVSGAVALRSNTLLRLEKNAVITGTPDFADYPVMQVRWEGKWIQGHVGLIYAIDAENIAISGPGKIAGNHALGGRPNAEKPLRHPALIEMIGCKNISMENFSTDYYLMWSIHPTYCENIIIKNLTIRSTGGNGDGIDIDSCRHVIIDGCDIASGDDCISLKSGRGMEANTLMKTTEDVHISNCTLSDSIFACIGIGSETSGGIRNVTIKHCKFIETKKFAIYIKSRPGRGAFVEDITVDDLDVSGMEQGFLRINMLNSGIQDQAPVAGYAGIPTIKNFSFTNIHVKDVPVLVDAVNIHPDKPLNGLTLENISGTCLKGISLANIKEVRIKNISVTGYTGSLLGINNVSGKGLDGAVTIDPPKVGESVPDSDVPYKLQ